MALLLTAEILSFSPQTVRATTALRAVSEGARAAGLRAVETREYRGGSDVLVLWGPGHPARFEPMRHQIASGGRVLALDLAYWNRFEKFRVSIDGAHCPTWVARYDFPRDRFKSDPVAVADCWDLNGPVIIAGLGEKARVQYGADRIDAWEAVMMDAVRQAGRTVIYRAKKGARSTIEEALVGASALITWHSNAAVDAIRLGVPAFCVDGAAAAVCRDTYNAFAPPLAAKTRDQFLSNLAYFQWRNDETAEMWGWLREVLP